ncbi:unnamed protein product [Gordionus sp. m RMFG-2023]
MYLGISKGISFPNISSHLIQRKNKITNFSVNFDITDLEFERLFDILKSKQDEFNSNHNAEMKIKNQHYLINATYSAIVLVQIHDRWESLKHLVYSLSSAWKIESTLIIFSGDCFSTLIDKIIEAVDFAPYLKMYYPLTPEIFSGITAWDNLTQLIVSCDANPELLYLYKQIRKFSLSLIKLHWIWKMNAIFDPNAFIHIKIDNLEILSNSFFSQNQEIDLISWGLSSC